MVVKVARKAGETVRVQGMLYKEISQSVLLYGRESWVVTGAILKLLEGFHHRQDRRIAGMTEWHTTSGEWECSLVADALETKGIWKINKYILRRQATIAVQVAFRPIYDLCTGEEKNLGASRFMRWWDQDVGREV